MSVGQGGLVFVGFVCFAPLGTELLGSRSPNGAEYFWRVYTRFSFPVFLRTSEGLGKVARGSLQRRFAVESDWFAFGSPVGSCWRGLKAQRAPACSEGCHGCCGRREFGYPARCRAEPLSSLTLTAAQPASSKFPPPPPPIKPLSRQIRCARDKS